MWSSCLDGQSQKASVLESAPESLLASYSIKCCESSGSVCGTCSGGQVERDPTTSSLVTACCSEIETCCRRCTCNTSSSDGIPAAISCGSSTCVIGEPSTEEVIQCEGDFGSGTNSDGFKCGGLVSLVFQTVSDDHVALAGVSSGKVGSTKAHAVELCIDGALFLQIRRPVVGNGAPSDIVINQLLSGGATSLRRRSELEEAEVAFGESSRS